jgi:hypothetical protein
MDATQPFVGAEAGPAPASPRSLSLAPPPGVAADAGAALTEVAAFLRAITPRLSCPDAIVAALPGSGISAARLHAIASAPYASQADRKMLLDDAAAALGIVVPFERMLFLSALVRHRAPLPPRAA